MSITKTRGPKVKLKGITWGHSRGFAPMAATAQRFSETHPDVDIVWEKRTLRQFGDAPIGSLAKRFDLLVVDHPFVGHAAREQLLLPLDEYLSREFLKEQEESSVGLSFRSYSWENHQWALAIDAATPVCCWRPDLLAQTATSLPTDWNQVLDLARAGLVAFPAMPVDALMHFYMLCCSLGDEPFLREGSVVSVEVGSEALAMLRELARHCSSEIFDLNPIKTYETMAELDTIAYCPFAFGYSNYARKGYARHTLKFGDLFETSKAGKSRSTLGGAGLAISSSCRHKDAALEYIAYVASPTCQCGIYVQSGGQPGHRSAWVDPNTNCMTQDYFRDTLPALDRAYLRPRYDGYVDFQNDAASAVHSFMRKGGDALSTITKLQHRYRQSGSREKTI